jgi:2-haloacid dehalogenase
MNIIPKYSTILFDADGTLFDYEKSEDYALENTFKHYGFGYSKKIRKIYGNISKQLWKDYNNRKIPNEKLGVEKFKRLLDELSIHENPYDFNNLYIHHLSYSSHLETGALDICRELSSYCTLIIATNGMQKIQIKRLENSSIKKYIKHLITSGDANCFKPSKEFFEYTFCKTDLNTKDKEHVLLVGDSLKSDILGGINFGVHTCWYNPSNLENSNIHNMNYEINELNELKNIVLGK